MSCDGRDVAGRYSALNLIALAFDSCWTSTQSSFTLNNICHEHMMGISIAIP